MSAQWDGALMLYVGPDDGRPSAVEAELVRGEADRRAWAEIADEEAGRRPTEHAARPCTTRSWAIPVFAPTWHAWTDKAAAHCLLFSSGGIGRVETVRTLSAYRGRGLAAAVVRRAIEDSLALDHQLTYIFAEDGGAAQRLYTSLGFRTVMTGAIHTYIVKPVAPVTACSPPEDTDSGAKAHARSGSCTCGLSHRQARRPPLSPRWCPSAVRPWP